MLRGFVAQIELRAQVFLNSQRSPIVWTDELK